MDTVEIRNGIILLETATYVYGAFVFPVFIYNLNEWDLHMY